MSRLINTEEFIKRIDHYPPDIRNTAKKELRYCKTVDAASVVRCKDCKHRRADGFCKKYQRNIDGSATMWFAPDDDWFCADGEKVKKDENGIILKTLWDISLLLTELEDVTE